MRPRTLSCLIAVAAMPGWAAELRIRLRDEGNRPIAARLEVHGSDGKMYQAEGALPSRPPGRPDTGSPYLRSFVAKDEAIIKAPAGRYHIVAEHGLEYERITRDLELSESQPSAVTVQLKPWIRMRDKGWWSGDMHVHRPMEHTPLLLQAEDLNFGVVFTMWNRQNLWKDQGALPSDWTRKTGPHHWMTVTNAEDERGGGAWMLHGLREALGLEHVVPEGKRTTESWDPPGIEFVRKARKQKQGGMFPWFDLEKPIWWEAPVMMALERPDSLGLLHNHYDQYGMYDNEAWGRKRDMPDFSDYSLHLIYRYWNLGWMVTPSAGAASGVLPNPVGYNRMYVKLDGAFTVEKWYEGVRAGRVMLSNGPLVFFDAKRKRVEAISRDPVDRVEIVANGKVIQGWRPAGRKFQSTVTADTSAHSWLAARAFAKNDKTVRLGHTSPVRLNGRWDAREDARYFRQWIEALKKHTTPHAIYDEAIAVYRELEK